MSAKDEIPFQRDLNEKTYSLLEISLRQQKMLQKQFMKTV
jgi:hypothetical protein